MSLRQSDMYFSFGVLYVALYLFVYLALTIYPGQGFKGAIVLALVLTVTSPFLFWLMQLSYDFEGRPKSDVFAWRQQSWSFYGDVLLLMPACVVALQVVYARSGHISSVFYSWWWPLVAAMIGWAIAGIFRLLDSRRYSQESLVSPSKVYHDFVLIPIYMSALIATCVPVLLAWDGHQWPVVILLAAWVTLAAVDGLRYSASGRFLKYKLVADVQYCPWNVYRFRRCRP